MEKEKFEGGFVKIRLESGRSERYGIPPAESIYECYRDHGLVGMEFDEELYKQVGTEIRSILGEKEKYTVQEVVRYFQTKYLAHRIPFEYLHNYFDTNFETEFIPRGYGPENEFEYDPGSNEKNITLFIDTIYNEELKKRYPKLAEVREWQLGIMYDNIKRWPEELELTKKYATAEMIEQHKLNHAHYKKQVDSGRVGYNNPIIIIGYIEENVINSMYLVNHGPIGIDDIHYEMYYFYKHS